MKNIKTKLILISVFLFCIPAIVTASQLFPPEIPVLFYGNAEINSEPAPVNTIISAKTKIGDIEILGSIIKNTGRYFIEVPCQSYIEQVILFNISDLTAGESKCPDVQTVPSVKLDLAIDIADISDNKQDTETKIAESAGNQIILAPTFCVEVVYDKWQETCVNNWQYRDIISKTPENCAMTEEQKALAKRKCGLVGIGGKIKVLGAEFYPDNSLIRGSDMKIYLIENQIKRHVISIEALKRFAGKEIFNVADEVISQYLIGSKIYGEYKDGDLIRGSDMKIYVIKNNKKYYIINLSELQKYAGQKIYNASDEVLARH